MSVCHAFIRLRGRPAKRLTSPKTPFEGMVLVSKLPGIFAAYKSSQQEKQMSSNHANDSLSHTQTQTHTHTNPHRRPLRAGSCMCVCVFVPDLALLLPLLKLLHRSARCRELVTMCRKLPQLSVIGWTFDQRCLLNSGTPMSKCRCDVSDKIPCGVLRAQVHSRFMAAFQLLLF